MSEGHVYFIRPVGLVAPVKIGFSTNCEARMLSLSTWSPYHLEIAVKVPGTFALEAKFHGYLAEHWSHREWFKPTPMVLGMVEALIADRFDFALIEGKKRPKLRNFPPESKRSQSLRHRLHWASDHVGLQAPEEVADAARTLDYRNPEEFTRKCEVVEAWLGDHQARAAAPLLPYAWAAQRFQEHTARLQRKRKLKAA